MPDIQSTTSYFDDEVKPVDEKKVTIQPGSGKAVGLGVYKSAAPDPAFDISFTPDLQDDMGVTRERLELPGQSRYMLLYQFHNFGQKPCEVTMHLRESLV